MQTLAENKSSYPSGEQAILEAAETLFAEKGFDAVSMSAIARLASTSKPNIYHHFKNKNGLYLAVMKAAVQRSSLLLDALEDAPGTFRQHLSDFSTGQLDNILAHKRSTQLVLRETLSGGTQHGQDIANHVVSDVFTRLVVMVNQGQQKNEFRDDIDPALAAFMVVAANIFFFQASPTLVIADTGDAIVEGQLLAETDTSTLLLQRRAALAGLERLEVHIANGERRVDRFKKLSAKNLSSQTEYDDAREQLEAFRADYKAAEAQLAIVEDSLAKSRIIAPVSGVIQRRLISAGDFVKRGQALFEITRPNQLQAWLPYPETIALKIKVGQPAKIYSPLTLGEFALGEITELQPSIGLGSRAVMAIVDLENPGKLRPKATLSGKVLVETRKNAIMVPDISIVRRPAGELVYVISNDKAEARLVTVGYHEDNLVEITSGLDGSESVASDGAAFLTDGTSVNFAESAK